MTTPTSPARIARTKAKRAKGDPVLVRDGLRAYYLEADQGCGIRWARSLRSARVAGLRECGEHNFRSVRPATRDDVGWVFSMGGRINP